MSPLARRFVVGVASLLVVILVLVVYSARSGQKADDAASKLAASAVAAGEARKAVCAADNVGAAKLNAVISEDEETLREVIAGPNPRPEAVDFVNRRIARYEATKVQIRDCSPAGITDFYKVPPGPHAYIGG